MKNETIMKKSGIICDYRMTSILQICKYFNGLFYICKCEKIVDKQYITHAV